jgi:spore coat protein CotH
MSSSSRPSRTDSTLKDPDTDVFDQETDTDEVEVAPLIGFLEFINNSDDETFRAELGEHLDVEAFATYLAFEDLVAGGPGGSNVLVERFRADPAFNALYEQASADLRSSLSESGDAQALLDAWVDVLAEQAADLVDASTVQNEAEAIRASFGEDGPARRGKRVARSQVVPDNRREGLLHAHPHVHPRSGSDRPR